jgi:hypothetical protein
MLFEGPRISGLSGLFDTHPPIEKRIQAIAEGARNVRPAVDRRDQRTAVPADDLRVEPTLPDPRASKCRELLLRVMKGKPDQLSFEQRNKVYRRARQAIREQSYQRTAQRTGRQGSPRDSSGGDRRDRERVGSEPIKRALRRLVRSRSQPCRSASTNVRGGLFARSHGV